MKTYILDSYRVDPATGLSFSSISVKMKSAKLVLRSDYASEVLLVDVCDTCGVIRCRHFTITHASATWRGFPIVCTSARNCGSGASSPSIPDKNEQMAQVLFYPYWSFRDWLASQPIRT